MCDHTAYRELANADISEDARKWFLMPTRRLPTLGLFLLHEWPEDHDSLGPTASLNPLCSDSHQGGPG